jgi:hypothetical protein
MRGLTFEKPKKGYSLSECYANFLTILRIYRTTVIGYEIKRNKPSLIHTKMGG